MATYSSVEQINRIFNEHLESLRLSGLPFDEAQVERERARAVQLFEDDNA